MTWLKRALPAVAFLSVFAPPSFAQIAGRPIEASAGGGIFAYDTRAGLDDGFALTGSVGWRMASWFAVEASGVYGRTDTQTPAATKASLLLASADLRWNIRPGEGRVVPFVLTGLGYGRSRSSAASPEKLERGTPSLGAGALVNLLGRQRWYARLQVRDVLFKERGALEFSHDVAATASLHYVWGGKARDQDLDDVRDWLDRCPDTPIGATVDATGCPKDSDADGIMDGVDQCADTPRGCKVDKKGCPVDSDGDGVCDGVDSCAATPKGAKVDPMGCPLDSDGDGVYDDIDACDGTPKGCTIDDKGCPLDADGDGVCDALDQCGDTPAGAQVGATGCETEASKLEGELLDVGQLRVTGVSFAPGSAMPTPSGLARLDAVGEVLARWPELRVEIGVHTDGQGRPLANLEASRARADSVRAYLLGRFPAIKPEQLVPKGYGSTRPLASNDSEAGRALNRRIEFVVLNKSAIVQAGGKRRLGAH